MAHQFNNEIMRAYDIRGTYGKTLHDLDAYHLGRSICKVMHDRGLSPDIVIARDARLSSPALHEALLKGLMESGAKVVDLGVGPTPLMYFADVRLKTSAGIIITGSHNPADQNGFKIVMQNMPFYESDIQALKGIAEKGEYINAHGFYRQLDMKFEYMRSMIESSGCNIGKKLKIAWDPGNGAAGQLTEMLANNISNAEHIVINSEIDGTFPNHHPDPTVLENMQQLIKVVQENKCDLGVAFDGDGDRLGVIDNTGRMLFGDQILVLLAADASKRFDNPKVICDVKTSDVMMNEMKKYGAVPILWKTGHSLIKVKLFEEKAALGGEMSGHIFFTENYYGFDDGLFAACKMINIVANMDESLSDFADTLPKTYVTPEVRIDIEEERKFQSINDIKALLHQQNIAFNDIDGVRVAFDDGWWLIRASNTQNCLVVRVEGNSQAAYRNNISRVISIFERFGINTADLSNFAA